MCVALFLVAWLPYALVAVVGQLLGPQYLGPYTSTLPALFAKSNCIYNPIVFAFGHPSFK